MSDSITRFNQYLQLAGYAERSSQAMYKQCSNCSASTTSPWKISQKRACVNVHAEIGIVPRNRMRRQRSGSRHRHRSFCHVTISLLR